MWEIDWKCVVGFGIVLVMFIYIYKVMIYLEMLIDKLYYEVQSYYRVFKMNIVILVGLFVVIFVFQSNGVVMIFEYL